ncbi:hypothetical protein B0H21DRAFT_894817 [Amylocystis lapponica]|nr:hypothetical protein B0H21DRAFT_894817 [Amylocystis lapponica]
MAETPQILSGGRILSGEVISYTRDVVRDLSNQDDLQAFVQELADDPEKGKYIKELSIKGQGNSPGADLPNLENIHFDSIAWDRSHLDALNTRLVPDLGHAFPTVMNLRFIYCSFAHFRDFEAVLLSFPALSGLIVESLMGLPTDDKETLAYLRIPVPGRAVVRLQSFHILRDSRMELLFAWLRRTATMTSDRFRLHLIDVSNEHEVFLVRQLLETLGPTLRYLTIGNRDNPMREPFIDISHNTGLVSLGFLFLNIEPHTVPCASSILAKLASPLQDASWGEFVAKVGALKLQKVTVVHGGTLEWKRARKAIEATFSRLPDPRILELLVLHEENHKSTVVH